MKNYLETQEQFLSIKALIILNEQKSTEKEDIISFIRGNDYLSKAEFYSENSIFYKEGKIKLGSLFQDYYLAMHSIELPSNITNGFLESINSPFVVYGNARVKIGLHFEEHHWNPHEGRSTDKVIFEIDFNNMFQMIDEAKS